MSNSSNQTDGHDENCPGDFRLPTFEEGSFTHILLGSLGAINEAISLMALLRYCDRTQWMRPIPTGRPGEYISPMTRRNLPLGDNSL